MKKFLSLALALICVFSLVACQGSSACEAHIDANGDMYCDTCSAIFVCDHSDANSDTVCDVCTAIFACVGHQDANSDGKCDRCKAPFTCPGHQDVNSDGQCEVCNARFVCVHKDVDGNSVCDSCGSYFLCSNHQDANADGKCDSCDGEFVCVDHKDANSDALCDICGESYSCPGHIDADKDGKCDECGAFGSALDTVNPESIAAFIRYYQNSAPTKVQTNAYRTVGEGNSSYTLESSSTLIAGTIAGNSSTVAAAVYEETYVELRSVEDGSGNVVENVFKTVNNKKEFLQGRGVRETVDGVMGGWVSKGTNFAPTKGSIAIGISDNLVKNAVFTITESENTHVVEFTVPKANVKTVFGMNGALPNVDATSDVKVVLTANGATITSLVIEYSVASSKDVPKQSVKIITNYEYSIQNITIE